MARCLDGMADGLVRLALAVVSARSVLTLGPELPGHEWNAAAPSKARIRQAEDGVMTTVETDYHEATGPARRRRDDERGEGVISAAIAVLIMAFIGVGMWSQ